MKRAVLLAALVFIAAPAFAARSNGVVPQTIMGSV